MVTRQEFIDAVEDFISDAFSDYAYGEPTYELTSDDAEYPDAREALIKFKTGDNLEWSIPIGIDGDGEIGIYAYEDNYLALDHENLCLYLWQEAANKIRNLKEITDRLKTGSAIENLPGLKGKDCTYGGIPFYHCEHILRRLREGKVE